MAEGVLSQWKRNYTKLATEAFPGNGRRRKRYDGAALRVGRAVAHDGVALQEISHPSLPRSSSLVFSFCLAAILVPAAVALGATCNLQTQWTWSGPTRDPLFPEPCITPLVVQLTDDNLDGTIDSKDRPDVVFTHFSKSDPSFPAVITAVDGRTGIDHFTIRDPKVQYTGLAAGDIDGDGIVEILAIHDDGHHVVAFENTGALKWTSDPVTGTLSDEVALGIADVDQDGVPEIYVSASVFAADGRLLWSGTSGTSHSLAINAVDLLPSVAGLEVLDGSVLYAQDGALLWNYSAARNAMSAIADFDGDGDPEVVVATSRVELLDHDGNPLGTPLAMSQVISQPLVADVDGDGAPELIVTDGLELLALDWTGSSFAVKWRVSVDDPTRFNSASAYDFDGDGAAEVIYHDQNNWYIFDGRTGAEEHRVPFISATIIESPVIANIDDDCNPEILISGCQGGPAVPPGSPNAVVAYECIGAMPARPIWNQFQYHVTNVGDDGGIPRVEAPSWAAANDWLSQAPGPGGPTADAGPPITICAGDRATLSGSASIPCPFSILLYRWLEGPSEICPWATASTCDVMPVSSTTYTIQVRCVAGPDPCVPTDVALVTVNVLPEVVPSDLGNVLRAMRRGGDVELSWTAAPGARSYGIFRDVQKGNWPPAALRSGLTALSALVPDVPGPPSRYYYRIVGESCSGMPGP